MAQVDQLNVALSTKPTGADILFLVFLGLILSGVTWVGFLAYHEGTKTEKTKRNGEAWAKWFSDANARRFKSDYAHTRCAGVTASVHPNSWGHCLQAITASGAAMSGMVNPFNLKPMALVEKCDMSNRALAGAMAIEKISPTPPGSAIPFVNSPLSETDAIDSKLQLRITVCDKGAYPIRIAEIEF
jgi:hypothetical protein